MSIARLCDHHVSSQTCRGKKANTNNDSVTNRPFMCRRLFSLYFLLKRYTLKAAPAMLFSLIMRRFMLSSSITRSISRAEYRFMSSGITAVDHPSSATPPLDSREAAENSRQEMQSYCCTSGCVHCVLIFSAAGGQVRSLLCGDDLNNLSQSQRSAVSYAFSLSVAIMLIFILHPPCFCHA